MCDRETKLRDYKSQINSLLNRTIISYDFQAKTDDELVQDAIERGKIQNECGLFQLGSINRQEVPFRGDQHQRTTVLLTSTNINGEQRSSGIKLSSFIYPCNFLSHSSEYPEEIYSTITNMRVPSYADLFGILEMLEGFKIFITTSWSAWNKWASESVCVDMVPIGQDQDEADVIREAFKDARIELLNELLDRPWRYFTHGMVDHEIALKAINEFEPRIRSTLNQLRT